MPTDRSLWVEDKYALRCRGCGEKFTVFRRRHHCRRCGQVFCYECLRPPPVTTTSPQNIASNLYQWLAPPSTALARAPRSADTARSGGAWDATGDSRNTSSTAAAAAELSMRLCRRCATTVAENATREVSVSHAEFESSLLTVNSTTQLLSNPSSPRQQTMARTSSSPLTLDNPPGLRGKSFAEKMRTNTARRATPYIETVDRPEAENPPVSLTPELQSHTKPVHTETEEEREVTYSIGRVQRRKPSMMTHWWAAHQQFLKGKAKDNVWRQQIRLNASTLESVGALVQTLSDPVDLSVRFLTAGDMMQLSLGPDGGVPGSAAVLPIADAPTSLSGLLDDLSVACTNHLELRINNTLKSALQNPRASLLCHHFANISWHVVRHTAVGLGANMFDHTFIFSIPAPGQLAQCVVYPGLVNHRRLPSKRVMSPCDNPRVLLLAGHLSYPVQAGEDLVDYVRSYGGYLDKLFQRLVTWHPDVIVVEGGTHHYLRKRIEEEGQMRLVVNVGRDFIGRLSWCLRADIIADLQYVGVGDLATTAPLGHCARFEVLELAEEIHCCAFRGFTAVTFHTLILRGRRLGGDITERDRRNEVWHCEAIETSLKEAIGVAHHLALQANSAVALAREGFPVSLSSAISGIGAAASANITMNLGCQFPSTVQSACQNPPNPAVLSVVKDTIVFNVVHLDQLFEGGGTTSGGSTTTVVNGKSIAAPGAVMSTLTHSRNSELSLVRGVSHGSLALSQCGSRFDLLASSVVSASSTHHPPSSLIGRAEAPIAHAYSVVQQKSVFAFYGVGDETLFHFLVNRCAGTESQVLYLHGTHRVKVTTSTSSILPSSASTLAESGLANVLCASQVTAFQKITAQQSAARALAAVETPDACVVAALVSHLKGYFSLRIRLADGHSSVEATDAGTEAARWGGLYMDVCSPHLLNISTGAFLEWVLYGWLPALWTHAARPSLEVHFQFSPLETPGQQREPNATSVPVYANVVTLVVEEVQLLHIEYPPSLIARAAPSADAENAAGGGVAKNIEDSHYIRSGVNEMEGLLTELQHATLTALDRMKQLEHAKAGVRTGTSVRIFSEDMEVKTSSGAGSYSTPTSENASMDLHQLDDDVQNALSSLRDADRRGLPDVAVLLADMRRHLFPTLLARYRNFLSSQRKFALKVAASSSSDTAAATIPESPSCLRRVDGCLYHTDRSQWIRLTEPSSILSAALLNLYGPSSHITLRTQPSDTKSEAPATASTESEVAPPARGEAPPNAPLLDMSSAALGGYPQLLSMVSQMSPAAAIEVLRRGASAEGPFPTSLKSTLSDYQWVAHPSALSTNSGGGGNAEPTITVEVLFPWSFAALQVLYTDGAPFDICAALVRCHPFSADGGKSHSTFFVTQDGRFLIKSVKPTELRHFREWAPRYFSTMADHYTSLAHKPTKPLESETTAPVLGAQSTLGKIMGLYAVHVQGSRSRTSVSPGMYSSAGAGNTPSQLRRFLTDGTHCFMVAEQLLFQRPVRETWDLKGSQRNRTTDQNAAVRLDVDLVQERLRLGDFFFCTPEEKNLLMSHLHRDTAMLADSSIMDYSLMVSVGTDQVFVGMIDFLHPYSSAKVLESKMKSGLDTVLGYTRRDPTIINPASYAARFMLWMDGYFNGVPDRLFPLIRARLLEG